MTVSGNDIVSLLDNPNVIQDNGSLEVLAEISQKLDSLTTLSLRITEQFDLFLAVGVTLIFCITGYIVLKGFTRF
jgi:hypothetical protein